VTYRLTEWRNEQWNNTLESLDSEDQPLWKLKKGDANSHSFALLANAGELTSSDTEKPEALAQFEQVNDP
jgi:hypothetical protein